MPRGENKRTLRLHPSAAKNFDEKAGRLFQELGPTEHETSERGFTPERHISHRFTPADVVGEVRSGLVNDQGNRTACFFPQEGTLIGLSGENYKQLSRLSEAIQRTQQFRSAVGLNLIESTIFDWMRDKYRKTTGVPMSEYLITHCQVKIKALEVWLPVAMTSLEQPLKIGRVTLRPLTKETFDGWRGKIRSRSARDLAAIDLSFDLEQKDLQGFAASTIKCVAEPERALEMATEESERALAMLRLFSPANLSPSSVSHCTLLGKENLGMMRQIVVRRGEVIQIIRQSVDRYVRPWNLDTQTISEYKTNGLRAVSRLLTSHRTGFEDSLLESLLVYSKSSLARSPEEKLIYILVALESLLLQDSNERIQDSIAVRMAYVIASTADGRQSVITNVKNTYSLRSAFIHHGQGIREVEKLEEFMTSAWAFFLCMIKNASQFKTKQELIELIERGRLSGRVHR
jgi:hypothetical protein